MSAKFIFITGGVVSSLGKGVSAVSIAAILKSMGYSIMLKKLDPYLNIDPGTMNPNQHGEVFVTEDGIECDLDLGHYERFIGVNTGRDNNITAGKIYQTLLENERKGKYLGATVQVIPHVTDLIKDFIYKHESTHDFIICEIGGTVGDIEALPFLEAIRQVCNEKDRNAMFVHLTYIPYLEPSHEIKTKPTQHSVKELMSIGIAPDILICRSSVSIGDGNRKKIALFCNVSEKCVIEALDVDTVYKIPLLYVGQGIADVIMEKFDIIGYKNPDVSLFTNIIEKISNLRNDGQVIKVAMIGKYISNEDSYKSVLEAVKHAAIFTGVRHEVIWIDSRKFDAKKPQIDDLQGANAVIIPGGFGIDGALGKINFLELTRLHNIPTLGICFGMQNMVIEFARNVLLWKDATSEEFNDGGKIIVGLISHFERDGKIEKRDKKSDVGGTMRLGSYVADLKNGSIVKKLYKADKISERHRHRYEVDYNISAEFEKYGMIFSGISENGDLPEICEISNHKFYIGTQFHPELKSRFFEPHPLFIGLLDVAKV